MVIPSPTQTDTGLRIRRIPFDFEGLTWAARPDSPAFSNVLNVISFGAVAFERQLCAVFKTAMDRIDDSALRAEMADFIAQEALHSAAHNRHISALVERYPGLDGTRASVQNFCDAAVSDADLHTRLTLGAAIEATLAPVGRLLIRNRITLFADCDARIASLFLWHFSEEIEHRATAVKVYEHLYGRGWSRLRAVPRLLRLGRDYLDLLDAEFTRHVPDYVSGFSGAFVDVPRWDRLRCALFALRELSPFYDKSDHDAGHAALPHWSRHLFRRHARGNDVRRVMGRLNS